MGSLFRKSNIVVFPGFFPVEKDAQKTGGLWRTRWHKRLKAPYFLQSVEVRQMSLLHPLFCQIHISAVKGQNNHLT
ncbi:MAG: hypothetical protein DYG83_05145 [Candidatus Brocadia sp. AMX2]|nr:MAG: hypothetical protein EDM70_10715 [Candidatus Brocadia sp. AMX2]MBC6931990.1 hypothetical protein [Candidatus Brocadia sp.]MBL1168247.1 hypothetical protein [Candidatus Brocadia sp. AMX1]MCE7866208.1 hypothetical protein [Candidatus Brocadia sp. AMX2]MCQ3917076.1 hypothetical protein [Candidatus Brocadia sp.]